MSKKWNFWEIKKLSELSQEEWESLCDRCGFCCLLKAEDEESGRVFITNVICSYYNCLNRKCDNYEQRSRTDVDCLVLTYENVPEYSWLPETCAYRLLSQNKLLPESHPLRSGCFSKTNNVVDVLAQKGLIIESSDINIVGHILSTGDSTIT